ncbi:MAG: hypothetical protein J1E38_01445 [Paramuribaculum sp.]|nr:hypothetical protein [Paramuribaculum sp.]
MKMSDFEKETGFIARHYRAGLFRVEPALRKIKPLVRVWWTLPRVAAASILLAVIGATAAILVHNGYFAEKPVSAIEQQTSDPTPSEMVVHSIDFDGATLPVVIEKIKAVYGVDVTGLPENAEEYRLTLHYEGSAIELIETINEILDTEITIKNYE